MSLHVHHVLLIAGLVCFRMYDANLFTMLSHDQQYIVDKGTQLSLRCEFYKAHFNLFDNPVQWKKSQYGEISEINMLGNVKEPYDSTGRFVVTYDPSPPRYIMVLTIKNMDYQDSANYTCAVKAPKSQQLGIVRYTVFVKAPVQDLVILYGNTSSKTDLSSVTSITFVENEPTTVRCIAHGGSPPPEMEITIGRDDYTKHFRLDTFTGVSGGIGFRTLQMRTALTADEFRPSTKLDDKRLNCFAHVPGSSRVVKSALITVNYAPRIRCSSSAAYIGDRNVRVTCDVTARPRVTSWFWILDENDTTISEREIIDGYWTIVTNHEDRIHLQLYFRRAREASFRRYTLVAINTVGKHSTEVPLTRRYRDAESKPHASSDRRTPYRKQITRGRSDRDPSSLISTSGAGHNGIYFGTHVLYLIISSLVTLFA